jgi:hypothetical protein
VCGLLHSIRSRIELVYVLAIQGQTDGVIYLLQCMSFVSICNVVLSSAYEDIGILVYIVSDTISL